MMRNMIADKVILVDCDGVLCDWLYAFDQWMQRHDYKVVEPHLYKVGDRFNLTHREGNKLCRMFNESAWIRKLPPLRDAIKYVRKLHEEHGYVFRLISSLSNDEYSQHLRTKNLRELFGSTVFERYTYLDTGADKDEALNEYEGTRCWWIEDKPENAELGHRLGLSSILVNHPHNADYEPNGFNRADNWEEIYGLIVGA
jgi:FMN phosphatase YigB (HAD superfamily)